MESLLISCRFCVDLSIEIVNCMGIFVHFVSVLECEYILTCVSLLNTIFEHEYCLFATNEC